MIQMRTNCQVADNSGAKLVQCIKVLGGSGKMIASIGDIIVVAVKEAIPRNKVKAGDVCKAVVVRVASRVNRVDGSVINFDSNAVILLNKQLAPIGTRVSGPIPRELRKKGFLEIISLAPEVI